jgi:hypothetical protein
MEGKIKPFDGLSLKIAERGESGRDGKRPPAVLRIYGSGEEPTDSALP